MKRAMAVVAAVLMFVGGVSVARGADLKAVLMRQRIRYLEARMSGAEARIDGLLQVLHTGEVAPERVVTDTCEAGEPAVWEGTPTGKPHSTSADVHLSCEGS